MNRLLVSAALGLVGLAAAIVGNGVRERFAVRDAADRHAQTGGREVEIEFPLHGSGFFADQFQRHVDRAGRIEAVAFRADFSRVVLSDRRAADHHLDAKT